MYLWFFLPSSKAYFVPSNKNITWHLLGLFISTWQPTNPTYCLWQYCYWIYIPWVQCFKFCENRALWWIWFFQSNLDCIHENPSDSEKGDISLGQKLCRCRVFEDNTYIFRLNLVQSLITGSNCDKWKQM